MCLIAECQPVTQKTSRVQAESASGAAETSAERSVSAAVAVRVEMGVGARPARGDAPSRHLGFIMAITSGKAVRSARVIEAPNADPSLGTHV